MSPEWNYLHRETLKHVCISRAVLIHEQEVNSKCCPPSQPSLCTPVRFAMQSSSVLISTRSTAKNMPRRKMSICLPAAIAPMPLTTPFTTTGIQCPMLATTHISATSVDKRTKTVQVQAMKMILMTLCDLDEFRKALLPLGNGRFLKVYIWLVN